jgi:hypothetical protein
MPVEKENRGQVVGEDKWVVLFKAICHNNHVIIIPGLPSPLLRLTCFHEPKVFLQVEDI